jgi:mannose-1-phosphate guanylyltransferase/mannose-6-phosphate isomerase
MDIVILCGGNGTRLFPLSTKDKPKQFLNLIDKNLSMFQLTLLRAQKIGYKHLYIVCNLSHKNLIQEQTKFISLENITIIYEPYSKNTAPSIASICILSSSPTFLVLSTDHYWNDEKLKYNIEEAIKILDDKIVVFGIEPTYPETEYGYLEYDNNNLISFTEKPNKYIATKFINSHNFLWNSGNFLFSTSFLTKQFQDLAPLVYLQIKNSIDKSKKIDNQIFLNQSEFYKLDKISIDFAIMNYQKNLKVIKYNDYWKDIGSFKSLSEHLQKYNVNLELLEEIKQYL